MSSDIAKKMAATVAEMDPAWIEKSRKIHPMFWWKLQRLIALSENVK